MGSVEMNQRHRAFWEPLCTRIERATDLDVIVAYGLTDAAFRAGQVEANIFLELWKLDDTTSKSLDLTGFVRQHFTSSIARHAASAPRRGNDALTLAIKEAHRENPEITTSELERSLRRHPDLTFGDHVIEYVHGNRAASASISGLKDRLSSIRRSAKNTLAKAG